MIAWLNELRELVELYEKNPPALPWDSSYQIRQEYEYVLSYMRHHYILTDLGSEGWYAEPKENWRKTCIGCGSIWVVDGQRCKSCANGL